MDLNISCLYVERQPRDDELISHDLIFPWDTGHRVKNRIMIRNEVLNEKTTQASES